MPQSTNYYWYHIVNRVNMFSTESVQLCISYLTVTNPAQFRPAMQCSLTCISCFPSRDINARRKGPLGQPQTRPQTITAAYFLVCLFPSPRPSSSCAWAQISSLTVFFFFLPLCNSWSLLTLLVRLSRRNLLGISEQPSNGADTKCFFIAIFWCFRVKAFLKNGFC